VFGLSCEKWLCYDRLSTKHWLENMDMKMMTTDLHHKLDRHVNVLFWMRVIVF